MFSVFNCTPIATAASNRSGRPEAGLSWHGQRALRYDDELDWLVIPADAKRALIKWNPFVLPTRPDRETQVGWWRRWPKAQLALVTGARSRVIAIDADPRHGGSLESFYEQGWPRETPTARSGGCVEGDGGGHAFYRYPDDGLGVPSALDYLPSGGEVKSDGSIIILAPSLHHEAHRFYRWLPGQSPFDIPLAPVPDALLANLRERRTTRGSYTTVEAIADVEGIDIAWSPQRIRATARRFYRLALWKVRKGGEGRNDTLFWLTGQLLALGFSGYELSLWADAFATEVGGDA